VISDRRKVWCNVACNFVALTAPLTLTLNPHAQHVPQVRINAVAVASPFLAHDLEDAPGPQFVTLQTVGGAASGAAEAPALPPRNYRRPLHLPSLVAQYPRRSRLSAPPLVQTAPPVPAVQRRPAMPRRPVRMRRVGSPLFS
jgi:hypothetical protein